MPYSWCLHWTTLLTLLEITRSQTILTTSAVGQFKMGDKKSNTRKKSRSSTLAAARPEAPEEERPERDEETLTPEEYLERLRKLRAERAAVEYEPPVPEPKKKDFKKKEPVKPYIPPFDPNLPPAAFPSLPTIGQPIPAGTREGHLRRVKDDRERRLHGLEALPRESYHPGPLFRISGQDEAPGTNKPATQGHMSAKELAAEHEAPDGVNVDWEASNTTLNARYLMNMAIMAGEEPKNSADANIQDLPTRLDMNFLDNDVAIVTEPEIPRPVPKWGDLTQSLRVEIMDNLLEKNTWDEAVKKLSLTRKQEKSVKECLNRFHKLMEREDEELKKMRESQHHALLSTDHRNDSNMQEEIVLGRIQNKHFKTIIDDRDQKKLRHCKKGGLRQAWRFLDERGLSRGLAGVWNDGAEDMHPNEYHEPVAKRVRFTTGPSSSEKAGIINTLGQEGPAPMPVQQQHPMQDMQQHWADWEKQFTWPDDNAVRLARKRRLQMAFGADRAAKMMAKETTPVLPEPAIAQFRYNQRIERAKRQAEAKKQDAADNGLPFTGRDIVEGTWEQKLETRYQELADNCEKIFRSTDANRDTEDEAGGSELDEDALDEMLAQTSQFNEEMRAILGARSPSKP